MSDWTPGPGRWHRPDDEDGYDERAEEAERWGTPQDDRIPGDQPLDRDVADQIAVLLDHLATYLLLVAVQDVVSRDAGGAAEGDANRIFAAAYAIRTMMHTLDSAEERILELRLFSKISRQAREEICERIAAARLPP
jgi:hypothetical protein